MKDLTSSDLSTQRSLRDLQSLCEVPHFLRGDNAGGAMVFFQSCEHG
jgi:hypothetical protein